MAYSYNTITDILNQWDQIGVFTYVIPFLLIFAVVFAMLQKTRVLGDNRTVQGIVGVSIGLLALQFDFVSTFFAEIFPRFGVGLAIFLIFTTVGIFLRFPALRKQLKQARLDGQNLFITTILCLATCFPVIAHTIWAWQCAIYDSEKAGHNKQVLEVAAPLLSIMVVAGIFWMFFL